MWRKSTSLAYIKGVSTITDKIKVLLIEDRQEFAVVMRDFICLQDDMELVGIAVDGQQGLEMIQSEHPDVVILDMIMPMLDGISVLEEVQQIGLQSMPKFIFQTGFAQDSLVKRAFELGASYCLLKPINLQVIGKRIRELGQKDGNRTPEVNIMRRSNSTELKTKNLDEVITVYLQDIGIPAHIKGYRYLREALKIVCTDIDAIQRVTQYLYPEIAARFDTAPNLVERSIRHAIEITWNRGDSKKLNSFFGSTFESIKPTNSEFIARMAERFRIYLNK